MKFYEVAMVITMIVLSVSALSILNIIPSADGTTNAMETFEGIELNSDMYQIVDGEIVCPEGSKTSDTICKMQYLNDTKWGGTNLLSGSSDQFGFSDIMGAANMLSDTFSLATYKVGKLYDRVVGDQCLQHSIDGDGEVYCSQKSPMQQIKFFFIVPIFIIYAVAFLEIVSGRNVSGDR